MQNFFKKYPFFFHSIGWLLLAFIFFVIFPLTYRISLPIEHYTYHLVLFILLIMLFYTNTLFFLPKVKWNKNGIFYIFSLIILIFGLILIMNLVEENLQLNKKIHQILHPNQVINPSQNSFFISVYISIFAIIIFIAGISNHLITNWNKEEKKKIILKEEKAKAELIALKAQINPHFFFNTLNTIHSLTFFEIENSRIAIQKLSKMMRYVMNEDEKEKVLLDDEIDFIENYIELIKFRLADNVILKVDINYNKSQLQIAPMILLTFIENVFQHGISSIENSNILIKIKLDNQKIILETENQIFEQKRFNRSKNVGIENTIKRLDIIYSNKYDYKVDRSFNIYKCILIIDLK